MTLHWKATGTSQRFIDELLEYCQRNDSIDKVVLFGSRARGDYHRASDIDLAVFTVTCSHTQQNLIEDAINEMSTPLRLDIIFPDRIKKRKVDFKS
ncbi:nucleotidyltransferase domain-containing protein [Bacillus fonticola]|uniref:nucleotidyltransferase domain-containing protein n=1 Tax=Bacillus fonticola TaxID=2728853 RepID=UPI00147600E0|nr:nucleotidyltransferase domain-containing protein [Bacillus fonticola]